MQTQHIRNTNMWRDKTDLAVAVDVETAVLFRHVRLLDADIAAVASTEHARVDSERERLTVRSVAFDHHDTPECLRFLTPV